MQSSTPFCTSTLIYLQPLALYSNYLSGTWITLLYGADANLLHTAQGKQKPLPNHAVDKYKTYHWVLTWNLAARSSQQTSLTD